MRRKLMFPLTVLFVLTFASCAYQTYRPEAVIPVRTAGRIILSHVVTSPTVKPPSLPPSKLPLTERTPPPSYEDTARKYAESEYKFGIKLIENNFLDLAVEHFERYLKDAEIPVNMRPKGYLGLAKAFLKKAKNMRSPSEKREAYFVKAHAYLKEFISKWPDKDSREYRNALIESYSVEVDEAEAVINELAGIPLESPERAAKQSSAAKQLKEVINAVRGLHERVYDEKIEFEDIFTKKYPDEEFFVYPRELEERWYCIGFLFARAYALYPRIFARGTDEFKKAVAFATLGLEDIIREHNLDSVYISGGISLAMLYGEAYFLTTDKKEKAKQKAKVKEAFEQYVFYFEDPNSFRYLREMAYVEFAAILIEMGDGKAVLEEVWKPYLADYPNWLDDTLYGRGYLLATNAARAMAELGKKDEAISLLEKAYSKAKKRKYASIAETVQSELKRLRE